jgi:arylsulfatase A-like enzyme
MKPNILFLIIDSLRADKVSGSGNNSVTSNLDYIKKNGVFFDHAISSSDGTVLSYAGLFSAKHPFKTGMRSEKLTKLRDTISYFEVLKNYDYNLYGYLPRIAETLEIIPEFENNDESFLDLLPDALSKAGEITLKRLEGGMKEPWCFLIHVDNTHFPIKKPKGFEDEKFGSNNYEKQLSATDVWIGKILEKIDLEKTLVVIIGDHGSYIQSLKNESLQIDFQDNANVQNNIVKVSRRIPKFADPLKLKLFLMREHINKKRKQSKIQKLDLKPHEIRELLDQRSNPDRFLFDEKIRVPIFLIGSKINHGITISKQVRLIDVFPTICEIIGIPKWEEEVDGISLYPLLENKKIGDLTAYIESTPGVEIETNNVIGIRTDKYKYFRNRYSKNLDVHLFDLENDPFEDENIAKKSKNLVEIMEKKLNEITNGFSLEGNDYSNDKMDKQSTREIKNVRQMFKDMGYT